MNADRIRLVLDRYAAHFAPNHDTPADDKFRAAAQCQAHFDLSAPDLNAMLHDALQQAAPIINYAGSVQPLNGLFLLAEKAPDFLREALALLTGAEPLSLHDQQARMQHFADCCNEQLRALGSSRRAWEQNLRSAMALLALLHPERHYLYKSTEARAFADMIGYSLDVTAGSAFRMAHYYAMGDALVAVMRRHEGMRALLPDATEGQWRLVMYDLLLHAPEGKWHLFGDLPPLIHSRSRAGQANQERAARISRMQMEISLMHSHAAALAQQAAELPTPDLVGQRFRSAAFGEVEAIGQEPGRLTILAGGVEKRMALPMSILQGFLIPLDEGTRARYEQERQLQNQRRALENDIRNRETEVQRLQAKP